MQQDSNMPDFAKNSKTFANSGPAGQAVIPTTMKQILTWLMVLALAATAVHAQERSGETLAERRLRQLVQEERRLLAASKRPDGSHDESLLERRYQELVYKYDSLIQENPDFAAAHVAYALVLDRIGQEEAARAMYLQANRLDPNIPLVKNQLGNHLAESGNFDQALPYYLAAIELEPRESLYHLQLGKLLYHFQGEFVEAEIFTRQVLDRKMLAAFAKAAELSPDDLTLAYRHAEAYYDLETPRWEEAEKAWLGLLPRAKPGIERQAIQLHLAKVAVKRRQPVEAEKYLSEVSERILARNKSRVEAALAELRRELANETGEP